MGNRRQVLINLKEALEQVCDNCCCDFEECKRVGFCVDYTNIEQLPTTEMKHGRWKQMGEADYKCSVCGFRFTSSDPISRFKYCRCGAKMDGDKNDK